MPEITRNDSVSVGASVVQLSQAITGGKRIEFSLRNNSTAGQVVYLYLSNAQVATASGGIPLAAGQSITQSADAGYTP